MEFTKDWYPGLDLTQLATFRQEASPELAAVGPELTRHAAAIASQDSRAAEPPFRTQAFPERTQSAKAAAVTLGRAS